MNDLTPEQEAIREAFDKMVASVEEMALAYVTALQPFLTIAQQVANAMSDAASTVVVESTIQNVETEAASLISPAAVMIRPAMAVIPTVIVGKEELGSQ